MFPKSSRAHRQRRATPRKVRKQKALGAHPDRDARFQHIAKLQAEYLAADPVMSIDTRKRELSGNVACDGHPLTQAPAEVLKHDFPSVGEGKLIPYGLYDLVHHEGHIHLNTRHETSEFCCDSIAHGWEQHGCQHDPHACQVLLLCDGGGSNASNCLHDGCSAC